MTAELRVPSFGESISEALVARWLKQEGERVEQDEPIVVLETDKVTQELPAPTGGVLRQILTPVGEMAPIGAVIAIIERAARAEGAAPAAESAPGPAAASGPRAAPADPGGGSPNAEVAPRAVGRAGPRSSVPPVAIPPDLRHEELTPMSPLRRRIAERLVEAQRSAALLTTFNEIDMSAVQELRQRRRAAFEERCGARLGLMSFFVKATVDALKLVPQVNAQVQGDAILYRNYYDIGVAVGSGRGLVVPVLRDADRLSFAEVERAIADFAARAQEDRLTLEELAGGTFTITNGGVYGSLLSTPIVNHPQSAILGLHVVQDRPVVREREVVVRPMMYVALTYDHRIIDGREAVRFVRRVKECVEEPSRLLLEV